MMNVRQEKQYEYHIPVFCKEVKELFRMVANGVIVDATFGGGGHSRELLDSYPQMRIIGIDRDPDAISNFRKNFSDKERIELYNVRFSELCNIIKTPVDGILADLGVSSHQLKSMRGFSYNEDAYLDLRMDKEGETAVSLIARLNTGQLANILKEYGDLSHGFYIANIIKKYKPRYASELRSLLEKYVRGRRIFARVFQALRIAVNREFTELSSLLECLDNDKTVKKSGVAVFITYHSKEDKIVKEFFKKSSWQEIYKKGIKPEREEVLNNRAARSARLRAAQKI